jgi:pimeloyl-ACP methyl ester carboxylesterase
MNQPPTTLQPALAVHTRSVWFGARDRPALGWLTVPADRSPSSGVVIAPPIGYAYWSSHRTLRVLAEALAAAGHAVLRFDYDGTGDSAGDQWDADRVRAWRATLGHAVKALQDRGADQLHVIGVHLGGTFALLDGARLGITSIVAWMPVDGRRFVKELKLLGSTVPPDEDPFDPPGTQVFAGNVFSSATLAACRELRPSNASLADEAHVLIVDDETGSRSDLVTNLRQSGCEVDHRQVGGSELALEQAAEFASVPEAIVGAICSWVGPPPAHHRSPAVNGSRTSSADGERPAVIDWRGGRVREEVVELAPLGHVGVLTGPAAGAATGVTLVFLNSGSETHVGPGRAWVEFARDLALRGRRTVRVDFLGWGESADAGRAPGRPYDECGESDAEVIASALEALGHRVVLSGLCASAWIALRTVLTAPCAGVIAINPQLYWERGDPVDIDWDRIRKGRSSQIKRIERGARLGLWTALDALGHRPHSGRWLDELAATSVPIELLFTSGDDGLKFLRERLRRRVEQVARGGLISVQEVLAVDHAMHMTWRRSRMTDALGAALTRIDRFETARD